MKKILPPALAAIAIGTAIAFLGGATGVQQPQDTLAIQGVDGGYPVAFSGTINASITGLWDAGVVITGGAPYGTPGSAIPTTAEALEGTDGTNGQIPGVDATNKALYVSPLASTYGAGAATATAVSTSSAAHTGITANSCLRVMCDIDIFWKIGTSTPTADLTTSNPLPAKTVEKMCLPSSDTAIAYITASGTGHCYDAVVPLHP